MQLKYMCPIKIVITKGPPTITRIRVFCNHPTLMKEQCESTTMLDLQMNKLH